MSEHFAASDTTMSDVLIEAWVLHTRKYRDTSLIVELLTREEGRVAAVMRGARGAKSRIAGELRPFRRFLVSLVGRGELKTVRKTDFPFRGIELTGDSLLLGLYLNELLMRLTGKFEPVPFVFDAYGHLLEAIAGGEPAAAMLRQFEFVLLRELGYGVTFEYDAGTGEEIDPDALYRFVPDEGFHQVRDSEAPTYAFKGAHLLALAEGRFDDPAIETSAKRITRVSIGALLGDRPIKSRELFRKIEELT